jgi:uncharacterized SAM-binding protein YcdF (DUF218 family)
MFTTIRNIAFRFIKYLVFALGILALIMVILSFTAHPYIVYYRLGTYQSDIKTEPGYIVLMGAGGMPGPEGLMRCHFTASAAHLFPQAKIVIALPSETNNLKKSDAWKMLEEIRLRGVDEHRVIFALKGTNTYSQANEIAGILYDELHTALLIVSSPEHMYRCIRTFEKCGFQNVFGLPAMEASYDEGLLLTNEERIRKIKDIDRFVSLRYNVWTYMKYQITILREFTAIAWYKIKGYI